MTMKVSANNENGGNTIASNLLAPILFYLKTNSSSGSNDKIKTSEHDHNAMVHEVRYDPANVDSQKYKIYLNPFDTGTVTQILTKLNTIIPEMV